ncbi:MAG TPA: hypothetical protein VKJ01_21850, partial [Candidatus Solibacter sp.]|nr:hypothetical protein [Candidatus Solibacter sp.]
MTKGGSDRDAIEPFEKHPLWRAGPSERLSIPKRPASVPLDTFRSFAQFPRGAPKNSCRLRDRKKFAHLAAASGKKYAIGFDGSALLTDAEQVVRNGMRDALYRAV